jgi:aspartyl-tRNA(Asn)/glutamyl-tRNA(Gln) amidotransferase subunit C
MSTLSGNGRVSRQDIAHLARLSRLAVTDEELDLYAGQLSAVLDAVMQVQQAPVEDVPPTTHAVPMTNVMRDDVVRPSLPRDVVLAGAPAAEDERFRVPRILGEEE